MTLQPLPGGHSGETFLGEYAGAESVVRIYAGRSTARGPDAPEIDAALLSWLAGLLPVAQVYEVRRPDGELPGMLITQRLPGVPLSQALPGLDPRRTAALGHAVGRLLGRLAHLALPRRGLFTDPTLRPTPLPEEYQDLSSFLARAEPRLLSLGSPGDWSREDLARLAGVVVDADARLDTVPRAVLVHSDLNPKNVLVDPESLEVTGLVDWEFAHAGHPYTDLGNLIRFDRGDFAEAAVAGREEFVPDPRPDAVDLARAADLLALIDLATRRGEHAVADRADRQLRAIARSGDLRAQAAE